MSKFLLIALSLMPLSACSTTQSGGPTPPLPGNLAAKCPALPNPPVPLLDPARLEWEATLILLYGECAAKQAERD